MDERAFAKLLDQFPRLRDRDYFYVEAEGANFAAGAERHEPSSFRELKERAADAHAGAEPQPSTSSAVFSAESFWTSLQKSAKDEAASEEMADRFVSAFRLCHEHLVHKVLSLDDIEQIAYNLLK